MSSYRKNLLVGVVVLGGLLVLVWMIVQFGDAPARLFANSQIPVQFVTSRAEGLSQGSPITFRGVNVGRIGNVRRQPDNQTVIVEGFVDQSPPLPRNVRGVVRASGFIGGSSSVSLQLAPGEAPEGELQPGQVIDLEYVGLQMLPPEYTQLATELRLTAQQFRESGLVAELNDTVRKAGTMIDSLNQVVGDPEIQKDLKASIANIRQATATANAIAKNLESFSADLDQIGDQAHATLKQAQGAISKAEGMIQTTEGHIDRLAKQIDERLIQVARLLNTFQAISTRIDQGKGTAGAFVNDRRLYESLLLTSQQLNAMITDLNRLVEQWEQEGATLRIR